MSVKEFRNQFEIQKKQAQLSTSEIKKIEKKETYNKE